MTEVLIIHPTRNRNKIHVSILHDDYTAEDAAYDFIVNGEKDGSVEIVGEFGYISPEMKESAALSEHEVQKLPPLTRNRVENVRAEAARIEERNNLLCDIDLSIADMMSGNDHDMSALEILGSEEVDYVFRIESFSGPNFFV